MAKNARQRRAAKRTLERLLLARELNPSTQPAKGHVRAGPSSVDSLKGLTHTGVRVAFHSASKGQSSGVSRWALDGWAGKGDLPTAPKVAPKVTLPVTADKTAGELSKRAQASSAFASRLAKWRH